MRCAGSCPGALLSRSTPLPAWLHIRPYSPILHLSAEGFIDALEGALKQQPNQVNKAP